VAAPLHAEFAQIALCLMPLLLTDGLFFNESSFNLWRSIIASLID
jgi:hypothetical protein